MKLKTDIDTYPLTPKLGSHIYQIVHVSVVVDGVYFGLLQIPKESMVVKKARDAEAKLRGRPFYCSFDPVMNVMTVHPAPDADYDCSFRYVSLHEL
jgi:hypothetical protein